MTDDAFGIVGSVIADAYPVESVVAESAWGVVYRASWGAARAPVALKLLKNAPQEPTQQTQFLSSLHAEANLLAGRAADFPALVQPLRTAALTTADGRFVPYWVLEWLEGVALDRLIQDRNRAGLPPVSLRKLVRLLTPAARALERAHRLTQSDGVASIAHCNLRPRSFFVAQVAGEELIKILGFGMSTVRRLASSRAGRMSPDENPPLAFTAAYGAPEQWAPRQYGQTGPWTDVWGLARCLVEALAGRPLIQGDPATIRRIVLDPLSRPTPRNIGVEVPDNVEAVFARALALEPRARQGDAGAFWDDLLAALHMPFELRTRSPASAPPAQPNPLFVGEHAHDLEFDPGSLSAVPANAVSSAHYVPDLDLGAAPPSRRASGAHSVQTPVSEPTVLDLEDTTHSGLELALELSADEIAPRPSSGSQRIPVTLIPSSSSDGALRSQSSHPAPSMSRSDPPRPTPMSTAPPGPVSTAPPRSRSPEPAPPPSSEAGAPFISGFVSRVELELPEDRPLMQRMRPALALLGSAILVAVLDPIYAATTGEVLTIAGLRPSLLAGVLLLISMGLGGRELLRESSQ
jgi:serine/threonine protein kinase